MRHELLTSLHFGRLGPGDRVPSVRRLADATGMNRKTIHRAYRRLAEEGLLDLRPGSGTFIAERVGGSSGPASIADLLLAVNRCRSTAESLGLSPKVFASFLEIRLGSGFLGVPVTVAECNDEQLGLLTLDLRASMGLNVRACRLSEMVQRASTAVADSQAVITTDCHAADVAKWVASTGLPVYRVALDPGFPQQVVERARDGDVLMVVRDRSFAPVFLRLLERMSVPGRLIQRIHIHETREAMERLWDLSAGSTLCLSPLVESSWRGLPADRFRRLSGRWSIEVASLDRLRAGLAFDLAKRRVAGPETRPASRVGLGVHPS